MKIGKLLKKERLKRGLTQKEFCDDIITVSYYSKIEKDLHSITVEVLLELLDRNKIEVINFFQQVQNNRTHKKPADLIFSEISSSYYKNDVIELNRILEEVHADDEYNKRDKELIEALVELLKSTISKDVVHLVPEAREVLQNQVFDLLTWDEFKLSLYSQIVELYDIESNLIMIKSILNKEINSYPFKNQVFILTILLNFIIVCIKAGENDLAMEYSDIISKESTHPENFFLKMMNYYFKLLLNGSEVITSKELESIFTVIDISGMPIYSKELYEFYKMYHSK